MAVDDPTVGSEDDRVRQVGVLNEVDVLDNPTNGRDLLTTVEPVDRVEFIVSPTALCSTDKPRLSSTSLLTFHASSPCLPGQKWYCLPTPPALQISASPSRAAPSTARGPGRSSAE
jgi:hypothetical protein